ncbi:NAP1-related protein 1-like isoform X2 [Papaver somniferum]|uniref:NAP1-related protein 1-like isoform X2 n=1 Tax=Papaver somniferum TaxID=3469 RepID=UPI000E6F7A8B|nr:NAP1-related protein 1-like isoform X2 [Papaver somniferum]
MMSIEDILDICIEKGREVEDKIKKISDDARLEKLKLDEEYKKKAREGEEMFAVKRKYNDIRKPLYEERKELIKSIPDFWPTAILNYSGLRRFLSKHDKEEIIMFLNSVIVEDGAITFFFDEKNPHFKNTHLTAVYSRTDKGIVQKEGTKILWKDTTTGSENEIPGRYHSLTDVQKKSFFTLFFELKRKTPRKPFDVLLKKIEERLWPTALSYFLNWEITALEAEKGIKHKIALDELKIIHRKLERINDEEYRESEAVEQEFGKKARELQVPIEQKCNKDQRPLYQERNEIVEKFPNFWLLAFLSHYALGDLFSEEDQKIFRFVKSMYVEDEEDVVSGYKITFNFNRNPYFTNTSLTKKISFFEDGVANLSAVDIKWEVKMDIATEYQHDTSVTNIRCVG